MADGSAAERPLPESQVSVPTRFVFEDRAPTYPEPSHLPIPRFIDPAELGQPIDQLESVVIKRTGTLSTTRTSAVALFFTEQPITPGTYKPGGALAMTKSAPVPTPVTVEQTVVVPTPAPAPQPAPEPAPAADPAVPAPAAPVEAPTAEAAPEQAPVGPGLTPSGRLEPTADQWASLRHCEATGNYQAVNPSGTYRGAYQFDQRTWESVGGTGDPAAASPAEQDLRAYILYDARGSQPWPRCGRFLP